MLHLRGKGMPSVNGRHRGDLHVGLLVSVPRKLTKEQRGLVEKLRQSLGTHPIKPIAQEADDDRGVFERVKDLFS